MRPEDIPYNRQFCFEYKARRGYAPNPLCPKCNGFGKIHPVDVSGKPVYSEVILCDAPGCLRETKGGIR